LIFGFNTEVKIGNTVYHVQTEDHGGTKHLIETTVYMGGRLIHRRKNSYEELLDSPNFSDAALRQRLEEQHKGVIDELRGGSLTFDAPPGKGAPARPAAVKSAAAAPAAPKPAPVSAANSAPAPVDTRAPLVTPPPAAAEGQAQLLNPASWYAQGTATLRIDVKSKVTNMPLPDAMLLVVIQSPQGPITFAAKSDSRGRVELVFPLPRMGPGGAEIAIRVPGEDEIKYSLKPTTA
jgi:hypothetical protein